MKLNVVIFSKNRPYNESIEEQRQRQKYAKKHIGHETEIRTKMKEMVRGSRSGIYIWC